MHVVKVCPGITRPEKRTSVAAGDQVPATHAGGIVVVQTLQGEHTYPAILPLLKC